MRIFLIALSLIASTPLPAQQIGVGSQVSLKNNQEMTAIFVADQAARDNPLAIDWKVLWPADKARRVQTQALLYTGKLSSADDSITLHTSFSMATTPKIASRLMYLPSSQRPEESEKPFGSLPQR